jgi:putative DNA primase/helicase
MRRAHSWTGLEVSVGDSNEKFQVAVQDALGNAPDRIEPGRMYRFSTSARASDKAGWCRLFDDGRAGVFGDFRTDFSSVWVAKDDKPLTLSQRQQRMAELGQYRAEAATAQSFRWAQAATKNTALWTQARPVAIGDPVHLYLAGRGIRTTSLPQALRHHPGLEYFDEGTPAGRLPAMLGAVTDPTGQLVSVHRTYLKPDGSKADVAIVKKLTSSSSRLTGCSIKLGQPASIGGALTIAVAEGIETAMACICASATPTVSAISAHGLAQYQWPDGLQRLIIFADHDNNLVGQKAAITLARRAKQRGLAARILTPPIAGTDWADVWATQMEGA